MENNIEVENSGNRNSRGIIPYNQDMLPFVFLVTISIYSFYSLIFLVSEARRYDGAILLLAIFSFILIFFYILLTVIVYVQINGCFSKWCIKKFSVSK